MAGENDGGTQAAAQQQAAGQADAQQQQLAGQTQQAGEGVGKHAKTDADGSAVVSDNGGAAQGKHAADGAYQAAVSTCLNSPRRMVRAAGARQGDHDPEDRSDRSWRLHAQRRLQDGRD